MLEQICQRCEAREKPLMEVFTRGISDVCLLREKEKIIDPKKHKVQEMQLK